MNQDPLEAQKQSGVGSAGEQQPAHRTQNNVLGAELTKELRADHGHAGIPQQSCISRAEPGRAAAPLAAQQPPASFVLSARL